MNDPSQQHIGTPALIRRFAPYLMRYKRILIFDLFCAALTTLCDIVLPKNYELPNQRRHRSRHCADG